MAKVLFVGGTGNISLCCVREALAAGHDVSVYNRGRSETDLPEGVTSIIGEIGDNADYAALGDTPWDVVAQFMAFTPADIERDLKVFGGKAGHYLFISSASVYEQTPFAYLVTEETPAVNPYWTYSQNKIACEEKLAAAHDFNWTIVRPSHTVRTWLPTLMGEDIVGRLRAGKPLVVPGDGNAPWTLTRSEDFAVPFVRLFGLDAARHEIFHITGDAAFTWDAIYLTIADALGLKAEIVHVPTDRIVELAPEQNGQLRGDKAWTTIFDNSKIKAAIGDFSAESDLSKILAGPVAWSTANRSEPSDAAKALDETLDRIIADARR